jgi:membrane-bound lytic murein transglycosylase F
MHLPLRHGCIGAVLALLAACGTRTEEKPAERPARDWAAIQQRDTLVVLTQFNSTSYFVYRGEPMGLEYELLQEFARENDMELHTEVVRDQDEMLKRLARGDGDVAAARLIPTQGLASRFGFTRQIYSSRPTVIQRTGPAASVPGTPAPAPHAPVRVRARPITTPAELAGATVHVPDGSPFRGVLAELSDTLTGDITVVEVGGDTATESLVRQVASGQIELAVAPENLARLKQSYFENVEVRPALGPPHPVAWATRADAPNLRATLDRWLEAKAQDGTLEKMYQKYFVDRRGYRERVESEYLTSRTGRLSTYDELFRRYAARLGWDWRLLASQAYQESRFDPRARSWAGAQGLLQLMPGTARDLRVGNVLDPEQNVQGAVRFLADLSSRWDSVIPDPAERLKFVLASYNTGPGHVEDARRLAKKNGGDPTRWDDVAFWLVQKSKRAVYTDPVVEHGFSRGLEPVLYVSRVLERFGHYRQFVPAAPARGG